MANPPNHINGEAATKELEMPENLKNGVIGWDRADIQFVLPAHRGAKLLLDRVESYPKSFVRGILEVTPERCVGFCFVDKEELVLTAPDLIEMASQLLGVWGYHYKEVFAERHRKFVTAIIHNAVFRKRVKAGETVFIDIAVDNIKVRGSDDSQQFVVRGTEFVIKVGEEVRGTISEIVLMTPKE